MSNAKPSAAMAQISHCSGVRRLEGIFWDRGDRRRKSASAAASIRESPVFILLICLSHITMTSLRFCVLLLVLIPWSAAAQTSATLTGRIVDSSGAVVPGATITVRHDA